MVVSRLPKWKVYLYDLARRVDIFKRINTNDITFGIRPGESWIIRNLLTNFGKGEVLHKQRAFQYHEYVKTVEENQARCSKTEYRIAVKLSQIKKLHLEDLLMELAKLRKFAKEVGLTFNDTKGLSEDELVNKIVNACDPEKKYSEDFVGWYNSLPPELFDEAGEETATSEPETAGSDEMPSQDEMLEAIESAEDEETLRDIVNEYPSIFDVKTFKKLKDVEKLQEAMYETAQNFYSGGGEEAEAEPEKTEEAGEEVSKEDLLEGVQGTDDLDELKAIAKEFPDIFPGTIMRGRISAETLKTKMLECLGAESEPTAETLEAKIDEWSAMEIVDLKKLAKEMGVEFKPLGVKKDDLIEKMAEKWEETQGAGEEEAEVNQSLINKLIQAKDIDSLTKIAADLDIKLGLLEKKNPKKAGEKILAAITEAAPEPEKEKKPVGRPKLSAKKETAEKKTIFMTVAEMVGAKKSEDDIVKAVIPMFKELGKDRLWASSRIKQLIEIAKLEK